MTSRVEETPWKPVRRVLSSQGTAATMGAVLPSCPLVGCGVADSDEVVEPPTLAGRRLVGSSRVA